MNDLKQRINLELNLPQLREDAETLLNGSTADIWHEPPGGWKKGDPGNDEIAETQRAMSRVAMMLQQDWLIDHLQRMPDALVIRGVDLGMLESQRHALQSMEPDWITEHFGEDIAEGVEGLLNMLNTWADQRDGLLASSKREPHPPGFATDAEYLMQPSDCPRCRCEATLEGQSDFEAETNEAWQSVWCNECHFTFREVFTLSYWEEHPRYPIERTKP